jgi:hypothetical protein
MRRRLTIQRTHYAATAAIKDVGVDHGGFHVFVAEEFLDGADVVAVLEKMGGERVAEGVTTDALGDLSVAGGLFEGFLEAAFVEVIADDLACARIAATGAGWEGVLPNPLATGTGVFTIEGVGEEGFAVAEAEVLLVELFDLLEVGLEGGDEAGGEHGEAAFATFGIADVELFLVEVDVFDAEVEGFAEA